jgi:hypothetical protein
MDRIRRAARSRRAEQDAPERGSLDPDEVRRERLLRAADVGNQARVAIEQAERAGFFEGNPYHGKPLPYEGASLDPDWWMKRLVERERITGLGPPALSLRREDAELDDVLDALDSEERVREVVEDFDRRVIEARRQLLGGPPVITRVRDVDEEVSRWRSRRAAPEADAAPPEPQQRPRRWWRRR